MKGEFVGLVKLLPKQKPSADSNNKMDLINYHGRSYWVPGNDKDLPNINCSRRWEQAFRVYSGICTTVHPKRSNEIFQYVETINTVAQTFVWDNVN